MQHPSPQQLRQDRKRIRWAISITTSFVGLLWLIMILVDITGIQTHHFGIYPGRISGLVAILTAPLLHSSFTHLLSNTPPLLILGSVLLYGYPRSAKVVLPVVYFGTGLAVWLFARPAYHLGASGLSFGIFFFILTIGALRRDPLAIALSLVVFFMYSGMFWGVLPEDPGISFESHLFGALLGLLLAFLLRNKDPRPPQKTYPWEGRDSDDDDDWQRFTR